MFKHVLFAVANLLYEYFVVYFLICIIFYLSTEVFVYILLELMN